MSAKASTGYPSYRWISSVPFVVFLNDSLLNTTAVISGSIYTEAISKPTFPHWVLTAVVLISGRQRGSLRCPDEQKAAGEITEGKEEGQVQ